MTVSLAFLAPDIVKAAVEGRLPRGYGLNCAFMSTANCPGTVLFDVHENVVPASDAALPVAVSQG